MLWAYLDFCRPDMPMLGDLWVLSVQKLQTIMLTRRTNSCDFGWALGLAKYGDSWRRGRKIFQQELGPQAVKKYRPTAEKATHQFLENLLHVPTKFMVHLRQYVIRFYV
jgi:cytochrome P450